VGKPLKYVLSCTLALALMPFTVQAQTTQEKSKAFGDWIVGVTEEGMPYAAAINSAGDILMKRCDAVAMTCTWFQGISISCKEDASSPVLLNSPSGSATHTIFCRGSYSSGGRIYYKYELDNQDQFDSVVAASSGIIGFAMPLESGQFNVTRFSLKGAKGAINAVLQLTREMAKRGNSQTGNQRL